jgi:low affinity Fe/Cu permease
VRNVSDFFRRIAHGVTLAAGSWQFFLVSLVLLATWAASGPFFHFSDTWQLVVNTSTTILTYMIGILILLEANRQAKESKVVHDALLEATRGASKKLVNIDEMTDEQVAAIEADLRARAGRATRESRERKRRREEGASSSPTASRSRTATRSK